MLSWMVRQRSLSCCTTSVTCRLYQSRMSAGQSKVVGVSICIFSLSSLELNYEALSDVWPQWLRRCRESRWFIRRWSVHFVHPFIQVTGASKAHHTGLYNCHEKCSRPTTAHDISTHCCREIWGDSAHFSQMMSDSAPGFITQLMYF